MRLAVTLLVPVVLAAAPVAIQRELDVSVVMRDGVRLSTNIFRPAGSGRIPAILIRTPYNKGNGLVPNYRVFVEHGYAVVVQDVRGRYDSAGEFDPLHQEGPDGDDTLNWIARQPWSNGRIGMTGGSYLGIAQWQVAALNNPHLKAIFPIVSGDNDYFDRFYSRGGAMKLGHRLLWLAENLHPPGTPVPDFARYIRHLPLRTSDIAATGRRVPVYEEAIEHPVYDAFWRDLSTHEKLGRIRVPVFAVGGWYDNYVESDLDAFSGLARRGRVARLWVGPWPHNMSYRFSGIDFGPESGAPIRALQLKWFDYWLKSPAPEARGAPYHDAPLRLFVMGRNRWREDREWPPAGAQPTAFYLQSGGHANTLRGDGALRSKPGRRDAADHFVYDPRNPVPTLGGAVCCNPKVFPWGPMDQRPAERRQDVLVYSTSPLQRDLEVTGPVRVVVYVSTSAPDTDFTAKLVDVFPDGNALNLTGGILRLRYRNSLERPALAQRDEVYGISIDVGVTSNMFRRGHRIRLEISSSDFPHFDRNPNTGRAVADETELRVARQTIHHGRSYPSHLLLPVIPGRSKN